MKRSILPLLAVALLGLMVGCLPTYVGDPEKAVLDPKLVGVWHRTDDKNNELWAVHRMNDHTYLVQSYRFTTDEQNKPVYESAMTFRAWLAPIGGQTFVSLEMYDPSLLLEPAEQTKNRYVVARVVLDGDTLQIRGINPNFIKEQPVSTPAEFEKLIQTHLDKEGLYLEQGKYTRINAKNIKTVQPLIDLMR